MPLTRRAALSHLMDRPLDRYLCVDSIRRLLLLLRTGVSGLGRPRADGSVARGRSLLGNLVVPGRQGLLSLLPHEIHV